MLRADRYGLFFTIVICGSAALTLLMSVEYVREWGLPAGDFYSLVLLSTAGMVFLAMANDLIVLFVALETMSVGVYVLTGLLRGDLRSNEASMKYFLLGAFASGFLLYGVAFFYGATGSTRLDVIAEAIARRTTEPFVLLGMAFLLVGFGFKVALIPFQAWTPDVYEGAPTVVTAFMAVAVKASAFAAFARVFSAGLAELAGQWTGLLGVLAVLTMTVGNVVAISQRSVKRMLAYSSIAHAGYALLGLVGALGRRWRGAALLPDGLRLHEPRRVRRAGGARPPRRIERSSGRPRGRRTAPSVPRALPDGVSVVARRCPAARSVSSPSSISSARSSRPATWGWPSSPS